MPRLRDAATAARIYRCLLDSERLTSPDMHQQMKERLVWLSACSADRRRDVLRLKRYLYGISDAADYALLDNYIRAHKRDEDACAAYDFTCLLAAIRLVRERNGLGIRAAKPRRNPQTKSLADKIALHLDEINQLRADGYSWPRIVMVLRRKWRRAFGDGLDYSYLRKTVAKLNATANSGN